MKSNQNRDERNQASQADEYSEFEPGGFRRRSVALLIDGTIYKFLWFPISLPLNIALGFIKKSPQYGSLSNQIGLQVFSVLLYLVAMFYFNGFFYNKKGGTPGKLLLGLKVVRRDTGAYLSYWQAFWRETLGRAISGFTIVGYLWALTSRDRLAFHDLIMNTQVLHQKKK